MLFLLAPMGYGWGYRGWGAPYPRYVQRRRAMRAGAGGDLIWFVLVFWLVWPCSAVLWRR